MATLSESDLAQPSFDYDPDVGAYVAACPRSATTRGVFFQQLRKQVEGRYGTAPERLYDGLEQRRWVPFGSYALRDFIQIAANASSLLFPTVPLAEALRRLGLSAFSAFGDTMAGRVVLYAFGERVEQVLQAAPRAYAHAVPGSKVQVERLGDRHVLVEMRDMYCFVDSYHHGVLEGAFSALGHRAELKIRKLSRICDADYDVRWT